MGDTESASQEGEAIRIIDSVEDLEQSAMKAVREFVDAVNDAFPDVSEDRPRRKIIDSAFKMTEELVGASNDLARRVVGALGDYEAKTRGS